MAALWRACAWGGHGELETRRFFGIGSSILALTGTWGGRIFHSFQCMCCSWWVAASWEPYTYAQVGCWNREWGSGNLLLNSQHGWFLLVPRLWRLCHAQIHWSPWLHIPCKGWSVDVKVKGMVNGCEMSTETVNATMAACEKAGNSPPVLGFHRGVPSWVSLAPLFAGKLGEEPSWHMISTVQDELHPVSRCIKCVKQCRSHSWLRLHS